MIQSSRLMIGRARGAAAESVVTLSVIGPSVLGEDADVLAGQGDLNGRTLIQGQITHLVDGEVGGDLHIAETYGEHANTNVEYGGPALSNLSINARRTLATMSAELSAEFATFEADEVLLDYIRARNPAPFEAQTPDADAKYADVRTIKLDEMEPLVALPDTVLNNSRPVAEVAGERIDQAFIGSCANGTLDDLTVAAKVVAGRRVSPKVRLIVTPGSQTIYREAVSKGIIATLIEAGAVITNPTCGACSGGHLGVLGPNETCITASTRNFKGRMGDPSARIFMASPATVAASALKGAIADPSEFLR